MNNLYKNLIRDISIPDLSQQRIQIHFVNRIDLLMDDEKLNPTIKSILMNLKKDINNLAKKRSKSGTEKSHYAYLRKISA